MVNKITTPPTTSELIDKVNELVDDKQDTLVSGTNIKTINNTSILGSGNIDIQGGGGSYTAGTGVDITNDVISVTNAISTGAALGATAVQPSDLASVATSGSYNDLSNKPTIPSAVTESTVSGWGFTKNTGTVTSVNNVSPVNGNVTLSIPTVNNATLTITQGGVSKGTFTANASSDVTIALDSGGSSLTAGTGIDITNDVISVEGVKDQRNTSTAIKTWTGTRAQYDAIVTKDNNTLYNITDDTDVSLTILEALYPIGAIYIGIMEVCPLQVLGVGSWVKVSEGRVLQGADSGHSAGTTIEAGLPNHTHHIGVHNAQRQSEGGGYIPWDSFNAGSVIVNSGVNGESGNGNWTDRGPTQYNYDRPQMTNASDDNSIYGNSNTVQPPAYVVNIWQRTA